MGLDGGEQPIAADAPNARERPGTFELFSPPSPRPFHLTRRTMKRASLRCEPRMRDAAHAPDLKRGAAFRIDARPGTHRSKEERSACLLRDGGGPEQRVGADGQEEQPTKPG